MNDQTMEAASVTRKVTDAALLIIAVAAAASWLWRRIRRTASVDTTNVPGEAQTIDDKVGAAVGFPSDNAQA